MFDNVYKELKLAERDRESFLNLQPIDHYVRVILLFISEMKHELI